MTIISQIDHALGGRGLSVLALIVSGAWVAVSLRLGRTGISYFSNIARRDNPAGFWLVISFMSIVFVGSAIELALSFRR